MKRFVLLTACLIFIALVTACEPSGIAKEEMEKFSGTPTPTLAPTPEQTPIPAADTVQVDTSLDGEILTVNAERQKSLNCVKYNQVMINSDASTVTIKGACQRVVVNGDRNQITADASSSFEFNGGGNTVTYSRFVNGKQPLVSNNDGDNDVSFVSAADAKRSSDPAKTKK